MRDYPICKQTFLAKKEPLLLLTRRPHQSPRRRHGRRRRCSPRRTLLQTHAQLSDPRDPRNIRKNTKTAEYNRGARKLGARTGDQVMGREGARGKG